MYDHKKVSYNLDNMNTVLSCRFSALSSQFLAFSRRSLFIKIHQFVLNSNFLSICQTIHFCDYIFSLFVSVLFAQNIILLIALLCAVMYTIHMDTDV